MDNKGKPTAVEYICSYCGAKACRGVHSGRPQPGKCSRRKGDQPHRWVINKRF